jgi:putative thioredoxin
MVENEKEEESIKKKIKEMGKMLNSKDVEELEVEIDVDESNFREKVIEKSKKVPVLVDFYASWCLPCKILSPTLEKLAKEANGKFLLAKVNVDEAQALTQEFSIMSVPTVILFKNGKAVDYFVGVLPEPIIKEWLSKRL